MLQVIEKQEDAGKSEYIEFRVYRSPTKPDKILAEWLHGVGKPAYPKGVIAIDSHQLGTPVGIEFERAVRHAHENGIPFVWVNDPNGLYPPSERGTFEIKFPD